MPKHNNAGSKRARKASRSGGRTKQEQLSWPGRVARKIKSGIKKIVG